MSHELDIGNLSLSWIIGFASGLAFCLISLVVHRRTCERPRRSGSQVTEDAHAEGLEDLEANTASGDAVAPKLMFPVPCSYEDTCSSTRISESCAGSVDSSELPSWDVPGEVAPEYTFSSEVPHFTLHTERSENSELTMSSEQSWELGQDSMTPKTPATVRAKLAPARAQMGFEGDIDVLANRQSHSAPVYCRGDIDELATDGLECDIDALANTVCKESTEETYGSVGDVDELAGAQR